MYYTLESKKSKSAVFLDIYKNISKFTLTVK